MLVSRDMKKMSQKFLSALILAIGFGISPALAMLSFTGTTINQTFTGFDGTTAPLGWEAAGFSSGAGFSENRGSSLGGVSTGGSYAFDIGSGDIALGFQATGTDFTPGYFQLQIVNNTSSALNGVNISFDGFYLNNEDRSNRINFSHSTDGNTFTEISAAGFTSPETQDSGGWTLGTSYSDTITELVPVGGSFFLRFSSDDVGGAGSRDEFAIDNITFNSIPEPTTTLLCGIALSGLLRRRR